jgi:hypothetical protein
MGWLSRLAGLSDLLQLRILMEKPDSPVFRHAPLFITNTELYQVTDAFLARVWELGLYDRFKPSKVPIYLATSL